MKNGVKDRDAYKHLLNIIANLLTLGFQTGLFAIVWLYSGAYGNGIHFYRRGNWAMIALYALFMYFFTRNFEGYKIGYRRVLDIVLADVLAICMTNFIQYFLIVMVTRTYVRVQPMVAVTLGELILIIPWVIVVRKIYAILYPPRDILLIYGEYSPEDLVAKMEKRDDRYRIRETLSYTTDWDILRERIDAHSGVGVVLDDLPADERNTILKYCYENDVRTYMTPKLSDIIFRGAEDIHLFDTPLYLNRNHGLTIGQRVIKRLADIIFSLLGIILFSPIMVFIAFAIKMYDKGPVFYKQDRLTYNNQVFQIIKFRSMKLNSERNGARLAAKNDDRITPIGKVIRAIHFDEIPQLINILKGDMSVVGPRPERPEIREVYLKEIPEFDFRLKVKAGLTGYAQVFGKYNTTPYDKLKLDLTYIENFSFSLDIKIVLLTFKIIFQNKENTEGIDGERLTAARKR